MAIYTRTTTIDSGPTGDSVKQAVLDLDTDLTGIVAAYDVHDVATTSVHGFTGAKTGSGAMVGANTPTLITPVLGVASATSINKVALTAPATGSTLTVADGKTLTASATMTLTGTDATQLSLAGNLTTSGAYATTITTTNTTGVTLPTSGTLVSSVTTGNGVSATNTDGALAFSLGVITPTSVNGITLAGGANTFSATVGTASIDVAAAATVNIDKSLTVNGTYGTVIASSGQENTLSLARNLSTGGTFGSVVSSTGQENTLTMARNLSTTGTYGTVLSSAGQENTLTMNESLTIGDGNSGTVTFSAASKTLTVEDTSVVNQDLTTDATPTFAALKLTTGAGLAKVLTSDADGDATWETPAGGGGAKILFFTRAMDANSASVAYTGVGFQPSSIVFNAACDGNSDSNGMDNGTTHQCQLRYGATHSRDTSYSIYICEASGSNVQKGYVSAFGADGFTIAWTRDASPQPGTVYIQALCLK